MTSSLWCAEKTAWMYRVLTLGIGLVWLSACKTGTTDDPKALACDSEGRCTLPGYICVDGECLEGGEAVEENRIGQQGGTVMGPDGVRLEIPAGAVSSSVLFTIARQSSSAPTPGLAPVSRVYRILPAGTAFSLAARVVIPFAGSKIPAGKSAADVSIWKSSGLQGDYDIQTAGASEIGAATASIDSLSFFVAATEAVIDDGGGGDGHNREGDAPPLNLGGDAGPALLRDCSMDPGACAEEEPTCFKTGPADALSVCVGACQYGSDCPQGTCCTSTPGGKLCTPGECGARDLTIPLHRPCSTNDDCDRDGHCVAGSCYSAGGAGTGGAGAACDTPADCDLDSTDHCVHRLESSYWATGDVSQYAGVENSVCAQQCTASGDCAGNMCCRLAKVEGQNPRGYCVDSTGIEGAANCAAVTGAYSACSWLNPSTCDPTVTSNCILFEFATAEGRYCSKECRADTECGAGNKCCPLERYGAPYCIEGISVCPAPIATCTQTSDCVVETVTECPVGSTCPPDPETILVEGSNGICCALDPNSGGSEKYCIGGYQACPWQ